MTSLRLRAGEVGAVVVWGLWGFVLEEVVQWRYGAAGMLVVGLVTVGHKAKSTACTAIGLTALALLLAQ
ncbi:MULTISPECIES: hypothetical protein [Streptomycetaceae]|uniref:hypothetical protein n=1 Tax=Streptomycetaceae TaxID=2062 RepID=UPI003009D9D5